MSRVVAWLLTPIVGCAALSLGAEPLSREDCGQEFLLRAHAEPGATLMAAPGCDNVLFPSEYEVRQTSATTWDIYEQGTRLATLKAADPQPAPAPAATAAAAPHPKITFVDKRPCHLADNLQHTRRWRDAGAEFVEIACRPETSGTEPAAAGGGHP